uniref:Guanine deaminase n=1 Tax=Phallusia mammillata TaxID=59560 RepID=A0A6F9DCT2_9ASCI|nr:guanine deaminase [Phallusia mammillata]
MPGMIDGHIHASQYAYVGTGSDLPLLDWLQEYTFPAEMKYEALTYATDYYTRVVRQTLKNGTTTAAYFATIHTDASLELCRIADSIGQRVFVGKVNMDTPLHETYKETTEESLQETKRFLKELESRKYQLVKPIITPRFALSTTRDLLKGLGDLAKRYDVAVQTHIQENHEEVRAVMQHFPEYETYTAIYDDNGLLTNQTFLAHGIYLSDDELEVVKKRGSSIIHCPNSNLSIFSGLLDVRNLLDKNVKVCLGTDVAGGYSVSILDAIRRALHVSNTLRISRGESYRVITYKDAFRLATLDGARALGLGDEIGNFEVGKSFDALIVDVGATGSHIQYDSETPTKELVEKFIFCGDDRNISSVYVNGRNLSEETLAK